MASAKAGLAIAIIGALLILIDGIAVGATGNFYGWHSGGKGTVAGMEITLSIIMFIIMPFYRRSSAVGWTTLVLGFITMPFDGGFWTIGGWLAVIGGALMAAGK